MAEFCKNCIGKYMGLKPQDKGYKEWLTDGLCEGCGIKYMEKEE